MLNGLIPCFLLLLASFGVVSAQIIEIEPDSLVLDKASGALYLGDGQFLHNQSCRGIVFLKVEFTRLQFDNSTRMLTIEGEATDAITKNAAEVEVLLGGRPVRHNWLYNMDLRERFPVHTAGRFRLSIGPIRADDHIVLVAREPTPGDKGRRAVTSMVYEVGWLATSGNEIDGGPSIGRR